MYKLSLCDNNDSLIIAIGKAHSRYDNRFS